jgi:hypothetical protein
MLFACGNVWYWHRMSSGAAVRAEKSAAAAVLESEVVVVK